jgi:hypothetical protein
MFFLQILRFAEYRFFLVIYLNIYAPILNFKVLLSVVDQDPELLIKVRSGRYVKIISGSGSQRPYQSILGSPIRRVKLSGSAVKLIK